MKRISIILAAIGLAAISAAQTTDLTPVNMSFRFGGAYPLEDATRSVTGNMFAFGLDFNSKFTLFKTSEAYFSVDYYGKSVAGRARSFLPVMFNQRFNLDYNPERVQKTYYFLGIGAVNVDVTSSKWVAGARGGIGMEYGEHLFSELTLMVSSDANGAKATSAALFIGYKF